jgi:hypothetical protein
MAGNPTGNQVTNEIMYMANLLGRGQMPYAGAFQGVTGALQGAADFLNRNQIGTRGISAQRPPMPGLPADYKQTELAAGAAAERFRPGAGFPGQQAAERAYQSEKAAVAQQVAQDPALSQYDRDRAAAVASGDQAKMDAVRDQGMAIWQQKYGATPMAQPGGAVGMNNPLMQSTFGYQAGSAPGQQMGAPTLGPSPLVPQVDPTLNPAGPNYLGGEGQPLMNFADPRFENMSPEEFQKLLNQVNKK